MFRSVSSILAFIFIGIIALVWTFILGDFFKEISSFFLGGLQNPIFVGVCLFISCFLAIASIWIVLISGGLIMWFLGWLIHGNIPELCEEEEERKKREEEVNSLAHFMQDINRKDD